MNTPLLNDDFEATLRTQLHRLADHAPTTVPSPTDVPVTSSIQGPNRKRRVAAIGATVVVLAGGAGLTTLGLQSAANPGGADSPDAAVTAFADALANEDVLGMIDVTLPEEVSALRVSFDELTHEATRIGLLDAAFDGGAIAGLDVTVEGLTLTDHTLADDLVAVTAASGTLAATFQQADFPLGRLLVDSPNIADEATSAPTSRRARSCSRPCNATAAGTSASACRRPR